MLSNKYKRGDYPLLSVKNLKVNFILENQTISALKGISFEVYPNEIVALVGESGSGKSVSCYSILKLLPRYAKVEGKISLNTKRYNIDNLLNLNNEYIRKIRGYDISLIFQEPSSVLNPLLTIGEQIVETILAHRNVSKEEATEIALRALRDVHIPEEEKRFYQYPHELSGGLKQRVAIAIATVNEPSVILADEPTTALDVTVASKILDLFKKQKEKDRGILLITHDFGVVAEVADYVYVIKDGEILEHNNVYEIFENPKHPYTIKLLESRPIFLR